MKRKKPGYHTVLSLGILLALGAMLTLLPISYSYKKCLLGYRAHCTLTPVSTVLCVITAVLAFVAARQMFSETVDRLPETTTELGEPL